MDNRVRLFLQAHSQISVAGARPDLRRLEDDFKATFKDTPAPGQLSLWLELARLGVQTRNLELLHSCLLRLGASKSLEQLVGAALASGPASSPFERLKAVLYVQRHFQLDQVEADDDEDHTVYEKQKQSDRSDATSTCLYDELTDLCLAGWNSESATLYDLDQLADCLIDMDQWQRLFKLLDSARFAGEPRLRQLLKRRYAHRRAMQSESEENFAQALEQFEFAGSRASEAPRLLVKQFLSAAGSGADLEEYCTELHPVEMAPFWADYNARTCQPAPLRPGSAAHWRQLEAQLPPRLLELLNKSGSGRTRLLDWLREPGKLDALMTLGDSLNSQLRAELNQFATAASEANQRRASSSSGRAAIVRCVAIHLCLDQVPAALQLARRAYTRLQCLQLANLAGSAADIALDVVRYARKLDGARKQGHRDQQQQQQHQQQERPQQQLVLMESCYKLGLMRETLSLFARDPLRGGQLLESCGEHLWRALEERQVAGRLEQLDPRLPGPLMGGLIVVMRESQILATSVMVVFMLCTAIYVHKLAGGAGPLPPEAAGPSAEELVGLERMFVRLSQAAEELEFNASEQLNRAAKGLVLALKTKLEQLADSERIRASFKRLVDGLAARCMAEAQYRAAAMLYSQIEDNISAIKCLMRMGDLQVVLNFALLVRDAAVNRITINYLRHLDADGAIVDDFMAKIGRG